jgi:AraC-like DNA-binding protein
MELQKIKPRHLSQQIKYIYILRSQARDSIQRPHLLIPDGTFELILNFGSPVIHADQNQKAIQRPNALLAGGFCKQFSLYYTGTIHMVGIVFNPICQNMIVNDRMDIYSASLVNAEQIFGKNLHSLIDSLNDVSDTDILREYIEKYFMKFFTNQCSHAHKENLRAAVETIQRTKGNTDLSKLASHVCMSTRNFRRVFTETIGMAPKDYIRIVRSKNILHFTKQGRSVDTMAFDLGYYDPSHLIRDFKAISGVTPRVYADQLNVIDENFMRVSQYAQSQGILTK